MYCKNCGAELKEEMSFCGVCGTAVEKVVKETPKSPKIWDIFSKVGFIGGLVCFILSFIPIIDIYACSFGIYFIVFSALGKKSLKPEIQDKAKKGLGFSIAATIIGFIGFIVFMVVFGE